jgi:Orn/Lys/Arg decarboxylase, major domain
LIDRPRHRQYHTVLLADHNDADAREPLASALRALRHDADDTVYEILTVDSIEEALTAVALNGDIQAVVVRHDLPLRSGRRTPLTSALLDVTDTSDDTALHYDWEEAGDALREMRPHIDLYSLHGESIAAGGHGTPRAYNCTQTLLDLEAAGELHRVRMLLLTNCTFDGVVVNPLQVMQEVLAIKPDICFLWDEAWYAFATAVPYARQRTAMPAARRLADRLADPDYRAEYDRWAEAMREVEPADRAGRALMADPDRARVRV